MLHVREPAVQTSAALVEHAGFRRHAIWGVIIFWNVAAASGDSVERRIVPPYPRNFSATAFGSDARARTNTADCPGIGLTARAALPDAMRLRLLNDGGSPHRTG